MATGRHALPAGLAVVFARAGNSSLVGGTGMDAGVATDTKFHHLGAGRISASRTTIPARQNNKNPARAVTSQIEINSIKYNLTNRP